MFLSVYLFIYLLINKIHLFSAGSKICLYVYICKAFLHSHIFFQINAFPMNIILFAQKNQKKKKNQQSSEKFSYIGLLNQYI